MNRPLKQIVSVRWRRWENAEGGSRQGQSATRRAQRSGAEGRASGRSRAAGRWWRRGTDRARRRGSGGGHAVDDLPTLGDAVAAFVRRGAGEVAPRNGPR